MEAIQRTGAQAVHPGYGFLSENHVFQEMLAGEGVTFIGPGTRAITAMGDKIESKKIATDAGVNVIPGFLGLVETDEDVKRISNEIGYPVMIKASAGGGGKGMRIAYNDDEAVEGFKLSKDEARSSFGDDRIFIEKFIEDPRHIEIQLLADRHGNVVGLPERECSIQRRNQKVIEESPSVLLDEETRAAMQAQACALARAVDYESAGTVEMLCDKNKNFYFLEMNTRLQVEHPVTEYVTGIDLVEQMIRIASGYELPAHIRDGVPIQGWSIESRVYAEDPVRGFLPSTGLLTRYVEPDTSDADVRVDTGIRQGSEISMFYDPMISKLVTHGTDRDEALAKMRTALDGYVIRGLENNQSFLRELCDHPRFISGAINTEFIKEEYPEGFSGVTVTPSRASRMAAVATVMHLARGDVANTISGRSEHAGYAVDETSFVATVTGAGCEDGVVYDVAVSSVLGGPCHITLTPCNEDGSLNEAEAVTHEMSDIDWSAEDPLMTYTLEGETEIVQHLERQPEGFRLLLEGSAANVVVRTRREQELAGWMLPKPEVDYSKLLVSPMPGTLVSVDVTEGQHVEEGQAVAVVEAMKMQNVLRAPKAAVVGKVVAAPGDTLAVDQTIIEFASSDAEEEA
jgi:propionyl-CoA carboxylase alpha chain